MQFHRSFAIISVGKVFVLMYICFCALLGEIDKIRLRGE